MTPKVKFVIYEENVCPEGIKIRQPAGWKNIQLVLERHPKFYSLIEYFEGEFLWYGRAIKLFHQIERESGPDAIVKLVVSLSFEYNVWEELFTGLIDLSELEELTKQTVPYKIKAPIIRNDTWAKFINRIDTPVDQLSPVSLDGEPVTVQDKFTLPLPSQILRSKFQGYYNYPNGNTQLWTIPLGQWLLLDFDQEIFNSFPDTEIQVTPVQVVSDLILNPKVVARSTGKRNVSFTVNFYQGTTSVPTVLQADIKAEVKYTESGVLTSVFLTRTDVSLFGKNWTRFTGDLEINQVETDKIAIGLFNGNIAFPHQEDVYYGTPPGAAPDLGVISSMDLSADTTYQDTTTDSILLEDSFTNILRKIIGKDEVLSSSALDGYKGMYALQKILHLRGWSMTDKPFNMSFMNDWDGASPALALGLGYNEETGLIEIETIGHFFRITPSVIFDAVGDITRQYATDYMYKLIENGFKDWSAESPGGIDDVQTKTTRRLRNKISGKTLTSLSEFYAAALGIEQARRNRAENVKDFKLDEKISMIAVKDDGLGGYTPEVGTDFESVTNVTLPDTRINFRLTPSRIFKRWQPYYQGCLEYYEGEKFYFASGEGNSDAVIKFKSTDPEARTEDSASGIAENQDIEKGADNLILPNLYKATGVPITWAQYKTIRANKNNAIGIPYNKENRSMYINRLAFKLMKGNFDADLLETSPTAFADYMLFQLPGNDEFHLVPMAFQDGALMLYN